MICTSTEKKLHGSGRAGIPGGFWREDRCIRWIQQTSTAGVKKKDRWLRPSLPVESCLSPV